jgi:hypothetical protein
MASSDVKLACCRLCHKPIASDLGSCIHCGVSNPVDKDKVSWLQKALIVLLIVGAILAALRYDPGRSATSDCYSQETGRSRDC